MLAFVRMGSRTVWAVLEATAAKHPDRAALQQPLGGGKYRAWTWREYADIAREVAVGLRAMGVAKGEIVALASETRAEFYLADQGAMAAGAIAAALYTSLPPAEQARALRTCRGSRGVRRKRSLRPCAGEIPSARGRRPLDSPDRRSGESPGWARHSRKRPRGGTPHSRLRSGRLRAHSRRIRRFRPRHPLYDLRRYRRAQDGTGDAPRHRDQSRHGPACSAAFPRGFHHRLSAFGAHRAARCRGTAAGARRRLRVVLRKSQQAAAGAARDQAHFLSGSAARLGARVLLHRRRDPQAPRAGAPPVLRRRRPGIGSRPPAPAR